MSCGCGENRITIVRGNDTNFYGQSFVTLNLTTNVWDLSTMKATITLGGVTKTFDDISNGVINLSYTAQETSAMPFGDIDGVLKMYDGENQIATIESLLPFRVISVVHGNAIAVTPAEFNIEVKQGGSTVLNIDVEAGVSVEVGSTETLPAGSSATVENVGSANHLVLNFGIPEGEQGEEGPEGPAGQDAKINGINTLTLNATYGITLSQSGSTATISGKEITDVVDGISALIPSQASEQNQLADKNFVNSSIATNTANFIGTFNSLEDLEAYSGPLTNNDYAFVVGTDEQGNTVYDRYKYTTATTPASWVFEYELNNSSFTANQWAAINSGATTTNIGQIGTNTTAIGNLSTLTTEAKNNLVAAINELDSEKQPAGNYVTTDTAQTITGEKTTTEPFVIQNGEEVGGLIIGADAGEKTLTDNTRKMFRMLSPTNEDSDFYCADISFDTIAQEGGGTKNSVSIGGRKGDPSNTAPDEFNILIATEHNATESNKKLVLLRMTKDGADFRTQPSYNGTNLVTSADIANMATTNTAQDITSPKTFKNGGNTFEGSVWNDILKVKRSEAGNSFVTFANNGGNIGCLGVRSTQEPIWVNSTNTQNAFLVRALNLTDASVGSATQPVYIDSNGVAKACNINKALNTLATSGTISPATNTYNYVAPTGAITLSLPATPDTTIVNEIELQVNQTSAVGFDFGTVLWGEEGTPDMSVGIWDFVFCYIAGHWTASYKKWETS